MLGFIYMVLSTLSSLLCCRRREVPGRCTPPQFRLLRPSKSFDLATGPSHMARVLRECVPCRGEQCGDVSLPVRRVRPDESRQLRLPLVPVREQFLCRQNPSQHAVIHDQSHFATPKRRPPTHPCCTAAPRGSRSSTLRWGSRRWRRRGTTPGRSRSRCTLSCRCRSASCGGCRRPAPRPRW